MSFSRHAWSESLEPSTAADNAEDISILVDFSEKDLCNWYDSTFPLFITIGNSLHFEDTSVLIDSIETQEVEYIDLDAEARARLDRPLQTSEHTWAEYSGRIVLFEDIADLSTREFDKDDVVSCSDCLQVRV